MTKRLPWVELMRRKAERIGQMYTFCACGRRVTKVGGTVCWRCLTPVHCDFLSDPTIPMDLRRGGMREAADGLD
jgi:hypothetical protein